MRTAFFISVTTGISGNVSATGSVTEAYPRYGRENCVTDVLRKYVTCFRRMKRGEEQATYLKKNARVDAGVTVSVKSVSGE